MRGIMKSLLRILPVRGTMGPLTYLAIIGLLLLFRYAIDFMVGVVGNTEWTLWNCLASLVWPTASTFLVSQSPEGGQDFIRGLLILMVVLVCTVCRLRDARLGSMFVLLVFFPIYNLLLIGSLCFLRTRKSNGTIAGNGPENGVLVSLLVSSIAGTLVTAGLVYMTTKVFPYGFPQWIVAPFLLGLIIACLHGITKQRTKVQSMGAALLGVVFCAVSLIVLNECYIYMEYRDGLMFFSGIILLLICFGVFYFPVGLLLVIGGALFGNIIQDRYWAGRKGENAVGPAGDDALPVSQEKDGSG